MEATITPKQNRELHALINELKIDGEMKQELVHTVSNGRVTSSKDLLFAECENLIKHLRSTRGLSPEVKKESDAADRMRKKCISICHEMGWKKPNGKIDMDRVNEFCVKRGHKKKKLNDYTAKELPSLITQFERVLKDFYAKG